MPFSKHLKGKVTDTLQTPLPFVNIIANPQDSLAQIKFAISAENGYYELDLEDYLYDISVSHLGYENAKFKINPTHETQRDIILKEGNNVLDAVVLELPVITKEDTIIFNVEKIVTGEERKLKDVLKKLPGVEVEKDGTIKVRGKEVTKVLVENKKFFSGSSKLAIDNIPADVVTQIEILDNYNEIAFLKGLQDSDEMALNVKLKEDKKSFIFGDIEAGKGNDNFYRAHSNLFYYGPKTTLNAIVNSNNIRERTFTNNQYFNDRDNINTTFKQGTTTFETPDNDNSQFSEPDDVVKSDRTFGGLNFTQEVSNKLSISGYGIIAHTDENTQTETLNRYNTFTESRSTSNDIKNLFTTGKLDVAYLPNLTEQWFTKTKIKKAINEYNSSLLSQVDTLANSFLIDNRVEETSFNQVIEWHKKKSATHTFSALANYTFTNGTPNSQWTASNGILNGLIPIIEEPVIQLEQSKRIKNHQLDAVFKHYWVLNRNNHVYSTIGNAYINQQFFTRDVQNLENGIVNDFSGSNFGNDLQFRLNDVFIGLHYKFKIGIFSFDQGAFVHHYNWQIDQNTSTSVSLSKTVLLPSFTTEAKLSQSKEIKFTYNLQTSFSDVSQFTNNLYLKSYNSVYLGNENLENSLYHSLRLRFFKFSGYRGFRYYGTARYIEKIQGIVNAVRFEGINQSVSPLFIDDPEARWNVNGNVSKRVWDVNLSTNFGYNTATYKQQTNEVFQENTNTSINYSAQARTLFKDLPNITVGLNQNRGNFTLDNSTSRFITTEPFVTIEYDFWNGFIGSFEFSSFTYRNSTLNQKNNYSIGDASLLYQKENSPWSFKLEGTNIFNATFKNSNSFSTFIISDTQTFILPRIMVFSVGYNL